MSELRKGLSLTKTVAFLKKYQYTVTCVYAEKALSTVVFLECATPATLKTFFVHIPSVYRMDYASLGDGIPLRYVTKISQSPSAKRQSEYVLKIRGPLLEGDLLLVSSESMCHSKADNTFVFYDTTNEIEEESEEEEESEDDINELEREANALLAQNEMEPMDAEEEIPLQTVVTHSSLQSLRDNDSSMPEDSSDDDGVQIVFEDHSEGEQIESLEESQSEDSSDEFSDEFAGDRVPGNLLDSELAVGFIYASIDVNILFKRIGNYELEVTGVYDQIEDGEAESRKQRVDNITSLAKTLVEKVGEKVAHASVQEKELKTQLTRLTKILNSTSELRERILKDPSRYKDTEEDVMNLITTTRGAIQELNIELARHREEVDELLIDYLSSFKALAEL